MFSLRAPRLNIALLNDHQCEEFIKQEIKEYLELNNNEDISPSVLWDAEGQTYNVVFKKEKEKLAVLTTKLKTLERQHMELNYPQINAIK